MNTTQSSLSGKAEDNSVASGGGAANADSPSKRRFLVGDRVAWTDSVLDIKTMERRDYFDVGTVYRVDRKRAAVMPDTWAREGKRQGLLKPFDELSHL